MSQPPISTSTLADMKARIADELARTDLTSEIALAIMDAIQFYQPERFAFNENRDMTFSTVGGQEFYTSSDNPNIPLLMGIDYLILYLGSIPWPIHRVEPIDIEIYNQNGLMKGQPIMFCYFNKQIRLGPVPDQIYSMRIAGQATYAAPASDTEVNNPWMIDGEKLVRSRAKWEIAMNVTKDPMEAQTAKAQEIEAYETLKGLANRLVGTNRIRPSQF